MEPTADEVKAKIDETKARIARIQIVVANYEESLKPYIEQDPDDESLVPRLIKQRLLRTISKLDTLNAELERLEDEQ